MNSYPEYKNTGFEWLGDIPLHWKLSRIGNFFQERSEKVDDTSFPPLSVTMKGIVDQLSDVAKTNDNDNRKLVRKDDFVINSRSDRKGSSGISPRDGSVSVINIVLEPSNIEPSYIEHLFKGYYFKEEFFRNGKGIHWDLWSTRWDQLKNINIPVPPIKTQILISKFLDKKTSQIDSLIEKTQRKILLLKEQRTSLINQCVTKGLDPNVEMKDSGIEWIGEIPKHWDVRRLCTLGNFFKGKNITKGDLVENGLPCILYSQIYTTYERIVDDEIKFFISRETDEYSTKIKKGCFLFTSSGESVEDIGKTLLYFGEDDISVGGDIVIFSLNGINNFDHEYYSFLFNSTYCKNYKSSNSRGQIVVHIYEKQLREIPIVLPPSNEKILISKHLEHYSRVTEQIINNEIQRINLLKEYRQSLISNVVTGKVRVTEDMI